MLNVRWFTGEQDVQTALERHNKARTEWLRKERSCESSKRMATPQLRLRWSGVRSSTVLALLRADLHAEVLAAIHRLIFNENHGSGGHMSLDLRVFVDDELHVLLGAAVVNLDDERFAVVTDGRNFSGYRLRCLRLLPGLILRRLAVGDSRNTDKQ